MGDACVSDDLTSRAAATAPATAATGRRRPASPARRAASARARFCIDGFCCNSSCAQTCYQCDKTGARRDLLVDRRSASRTTARPRRATRPMQYCNGSGHVRDEQEAERRDLPGGDSDCGSGYCVDGVCCNGACTGTCQSCTVPGSRARASTSSPGRRIRTRPRRAAARQYCDAAGICQSGLKPNGSACAAGAECGSGNCVDGVCCDERVHRRLLHLQPAGRQVHRRVARAAPTRTRRRKCEAPNYCDGAARVHDAARSRTARRAPATSSAAPNDCVDGTCCESACYGQVPDAARTPTGHLRARGRRGPTRAGTARATKRRVRRHLQRPGGLRAGRPRGSRAGRPAARRDLGLITGAATCDGAGNCPRHDVDGLQRFRLLTPTPAAARSAGRTARPIPTARSGATARSCADGGTADARRRRRPARRSSRSATRAPQRAVPERYLRHPDRRQRRRLLQHRLRPVRDLRHAPVPASRSRPGRSRARRASDSASDPTGKCSGMCNGHAHCTYPAAGTTCGTCKACNGVGLCNINAGRTTTTCGTIDCDGLEHDRAWTYQDLTTNRCGSLGRCKAANTAASCTDLHQHLHGRDGGTGAGGSAARRQRRSAAAPAAVARGNDRERRRRGARAAAGAAAAARLGATPAPNALVGLAVLASVS